MEVQYNGISSLVQKRVALGNHRTLSLVFLPFRLSDDCLLDKVPRERESHAKSLR